MATRDLAAGMMFLLQTTIGVLGNFSLLYHYLFLYFTGCRLRPTDLIVNNLIVANSLVLFSSGIYFTLTYFRWYHHLSDFGCRFFPYLRAVGRGVSIGTTCLLSVFQAITISPMNSRWAELKHKAPKYIVPTIFLYWILQMSVNVIYFMFMSSNLSDKNIRHRKCLGRCSAVRHDKSTSLLYAALIVSPDVVCSVLMLWASGSMVVILYRHKQRVRHIPRTYITSQSSPGSRAIKTIFLLVSTFVFFNTLSCIFRIILAIFNNPSGILTTFNSVLSLCFPTVSPFLLMSRDSSVSRLSFAWIRNVKSTMLMRNM
ncbi:vomeronasal type-1 receptor 4-like [Desmodus rotundus]|uniref:vomeronasal type-1 receptor 4-like n=1 Tax=Desmodus rotundus TaxID=9430 RepID=UPI001E1C0B3F|nr:vomeronasal type-1 receptor 4-like [Desmodus rotundus]XP_045056156.1 vomeronasal type-1 receptor 4-like [Desmodus rotundus]